MNLPIYKHLLDINSGFDQVLRGLAAIGKLDSFHGRELRRYTALAKEARAATNCYLTGVLERSETDEAGRRFAKRLDREQKEESRLG